MPDDVFHRSGKPSRRIHRNQHQGRVALRGFCNAVDNIFGHHRFDLVVDIDFDDLGGARRSLGGRRDTRTFGA